jgi:hypothetical protein
MSRRLIMIKLNSLDSREDFKFDLWEKALKDPDFRKDLVSNPAAVLENELGTDLAKIIKLEIHEESPKDMFFVLNFNPKPPQEKALITIEPNETLEGVLVKKAWKDPAYHEKLMSNPRNMLTEEFGLTLREDINFRIFEEDFNSMHIIIRKDEPRVESQEDLLEDEISDQELDNVTGAGLWEKIVKIVNTGGSPQSGKSGCGTCSSASGVRG